MLNTADVLVHGHPVIITLINHGIRVVGAGVAHEIPGGVNKSIHGVGFSLCILAAFGALAVQKILILRQGVATAIRNEMLWQKYRQILLGHRDRTAFWTMDDWYGGTPVALAGNPPITQAIGGFFLTQAFGLQIRTDALARLGTAQPIIGAGVNQDPLIFIGIPVRPASSGELLLINTDDLLDGKLVFQGKLKISLIMGRYPHDSPITVAHQHIVTDPHRDFLLGNGVGNG